jgi:membrane protease YdiL (CAAX protease family)
MHTSEFPPVAVDLAPVEIARPEARPEPPFGAKRALWIVSSYILTQLGTAVLLGIACGIAHKKLSVGLLMLATVVGALVGSAVAWRMLRRSFASQPLAALQNAIGVCSGTPRQAAIAAVVGLLLSAFNSLVLIRVFPPSSDQELGPLVAAMNEGGWTRNVCIFFAVCIAPTTEEFIFRGVLFAGLARRLPDVLAGLISIGAFALMHVNSVPPYWATLVAVSSLALGAQLARVRTGSLVPGIAMHTAYNAAVFALSLAYQS